jgi:hypothetical protein
MLVDLALRRDDVFELDEKYGLTSCLGGGCNGIAYLTKDGKVLKITTDINEKTAALMIMTGTTGSNANYFAAVYDVGNIHEDLYC